ncbi:membrane protein [Bacillus manliponensis]|uniref:Membrane protein n=1 Tax=Bacillus manliponensis TaxID=574376 RepID=A0A073KGW6_9BACI|nr:trimeric intracellular cation channel family protein [Bacillus manliponensis]KEK21543.1 membrane protein [Bacillus manliponensis]
MFLIEVFTFLGIIAAAISGTLVGLKKELDLFGVLCLAVTTALGGGIIRDILIGHLPPVAFIQPIYFFISVLTALFTCMFFERINKLQTVIMLSDAIGLGVFTAIGANAAMDHHMEASFLVVSMGVITGIGGGILRDICTQDIPYVFRKEVYAVASILGAISFLITYEMGAQVLAFYICLFVTFTIRVVTVIYNVHFPVFFKTYEKTPKGHS